MWLDLLVEERLLHLWPYALTLSTIMISSVLVLIFGRVPLPVLEPVLPRQDSRPSLQHPAFLEEAVSLYLDSSHCPCLTNSQLPRPAFLVVSRPLVASPATHLSRLDLASTLRVVHLLASTLHLGDRTFKRLKSWTTGY